MNMKRSVLAVCLVIVFLIAMSGCKTQKDGLVDGNYKVEMSDYSHGWKEFVSIGISNGKIVTVEYNAKNPSGFIKSWDIQYMRNMDSIKGTYPNHYTRAYAASLLKAQNVEGIDAISGATSSGGNFRLMVSLLLEKAKVGDTTLGIVEPKE